MNEVECKSKISLNQTRKTKITYLRKSSFEKHLESFQNRSDFPENHHFPAWYIHLLLNIIGIHIPYCNKKKKYNYLNVLFKALNFFWYIDLTILFFTFISSFYYSSAGNNFHLRISLNLLRALIFSMRVALLKNKNSYKRLLFTINKFLYVETLSKKRIRILILFTNLFAIVFTSLSVYYFNKSLNFQFMTKLSLSNSFYFIMDKAYAESFVIFVIFIWTFTYAASASIFTVIYKILSDILVNEFLNLSEAIDACLNEAEGNLIIEAYYKALEIGQSIDDVNCFPTFIVLGYSLISVFFESFRLFAMKMNGTYQVIYLFLSFLVPIYIYILKMH